MTNHVTVADSRGDGYRTDNRSCCVCLTVCVAKVALLHAFDMLAQHQVYRGVVRRDKRPLHRVPDCGA
jgi:hypothetical protein